MSDEGGMCGLIECVPNFSEGRDLSVVTDLENAVRVQGVELLDTHVDPDHNRSVLTLVGRAGPMRAAMLAAAAVAVQRIDLTRHAGTHPRIGAVDVIPLVPLDAASTSRCIDAASRIAETLWAELELPSYYYGKAAMRPDRANLATVRNLGFEALERQVRNGANLPDEGGTRLHPTAGAACVGVRRLMVAFNVFIEGSDARLARRIARKVRASSGGMPGIKALGMYLKSSGLAQVSMNLTDLDRTPVHAAFDAVRREAEALGARVVSSELVGLAPGRAMGPQPDRLLIRGFNRRMLLENRIRGSRSRTDPAARFRKGCEPRGPD